MVGDEGVSVGGVGGGVEWAWWVRSWRGLGRWKWGREGMRRVLFTFSGEMNARRAGTWLQN